MTSFYQAYRNPTIYLQIVSPYVGCRCGYDRLEVDISWAKAKNRVKRSSCTWFRAVCETPGSGGESS